MARLEVEKTIDRQRRYRSERRTSLSMSLKEIYVFQGDRKHQPTCVTAPHLAHIRSPLFQAGSAITSDEARDLLYATDYGTGNVGVIDARTGTVVPEVLHRRY